MSEQKKSKDEPLMININSEMHK